MEPPKVPNVMANLIGAINKIQDIFNTLKITNSIKLPQIVMLGSQSSGKSSVLESIVHRPFLPRGTGIVTRCPLVLQLIKSKINDKKQHENDESTDFQEWGEFLHLPKKKFTKFEEIRKEIERRTDELAGSNKGICHEPINLKIYSPHVVNLTLVDLPGITKVPVGDQPEDIEDQIKTLIMQYIKNPNSIILSVSAANADLATSESIKYAKQVDPEGLRTLAVLTKLDIMDKGTDAWEILIGNVIQVELGIIGTINRSQQNINERKTIDEQLEDEKEFFETNYKEIAHENGIPYLSKRLSQLLMDHIRNCLPGLKIEINEELEKYQENLKLYGENIEDRDLFIIKIVTQISKKIESFIEGTTMKKFTDMQYLIGGPKYRRIFDDSFNTTLNAINPEQSEAEIVKYILNFGGPRPFVFATDFIFLELIRLEIERLRKPSLDCVQNSYDETKKLILEAIKEQQELNRFIVLETKIQFHLKNLVNNQLSIAQKSVIELINTELSSVNTNHPDFSIQDAFINSVQQSKSNLAKTSTDNKLGNVMNDKIELNAEIIYKLIQNYFPIVKKTVQDQIPKIVMCKIINHMKDNMQNELLHKLLKEKDVDLLKESEEYEQLRKNATMMIEALKVAKETIDEIEIRH